MRISIIYILFVLLAVCDAWSLRLARKVTGSGLALALTVLSAGNLPVGAYEAFNEDFGDVSTSRGSVSMNPFASQKDLAEGRSRARIAAAAAEAKPATEAASTSEIDEVLRLIPSVKYFKIIADQYSQRSADYDGSTNLLTPLL